MIKQGNSTTVYINSTNGTLHHPCEDRGIFHTLSLFYRLEILKIHAGPITKHGEVDYEAVVKLSDGFNGADLRNVCTGN